MNKPYFLSMTARIFVILLLGTAISGLLALGLAGHERKEVELRIRTHHMVERLQQIIHLLDVTPKESRKKIAEVYSHYGVRITFDGNDLAVNKLKNTEFTNRLIQSFGERNLTIIETDRLNCPLDHASVNDRTVKSRCMIVTTNLSDGMPVELDVAHNSNQPSPIRKEFALNILLFVLGLVLVSLWVSYITTKPLRKLAQAANNLSRNIDQEPIIEEGPKEVVAASVAFNNMQRSIKNHLKERTFMLAAIAHDLQTPLTRLRLRIEKVEDKALYQSLVADVTATQQLIKEGLDFANAVSEIHLNERVDLNSLVESICQDAAEAGDQVKFTGRVGSLVLASSHALRRAVSNLVDNAIKYGGDADVTLEQLKDKVYIHIVDHGPGIPEEMREFVFEPFKRLEDSRSRNSGGTGLGMTIAKIIIEKHGGRIRLESVEAPNTGLAVRIELPAIAT